MNAAGQKVDPGLAVATTLAGATIALSAFMGIDNASTISQLQNQEIQQQGYSFDYIGEKIYNTGPSGKKVNIYKSMPGMFETSPALNKNVLDRPIGDFVKDKRFDNLAAKPANLQ